MDSEGAEGRNIANLRSISLRTAERCIVHRYRRWNQRGRSNADGGHDPMATDADNVVGWKRHASRQHSDSSRRYGAGLRRRP